MITIGNITNDTTGLLEADSGITINSIGGININGLISTASGGVSLVSSAGPITAVSAVPKHVTGYYLSADAIGGIGTSVSPLKTSISTLDATIASAAPWGDIVITNTGALNINTLVSNGSGTMGGGKILINNTGSITTGVNLVRGYGDVTIIANSPLTIGTGGVTSNTGNITLTAGATGLGVTTDIMNINGPVNAAAGNIVLSAGNTINVNPPDGNLNCLGLPGCVSKTENLNGEAPPPTPTCPTGQQLVGGICQPITCPTGYHLVGSTCQAITCPTGQQLVGNTCQPIICPAGQELVGNLCQPIACPGGKVWAAGGCSCPAGTIDYAGVCKTPSIVPGTDSSTVIYFPITEELTEPLQVLVKSIINTVDPSLFRTSGSPAGGAGDDLKPKKNYCN